VNINSPWASLGVPWYALELLEMTDLAAYTNSEKAGVGGSTPSRGTTP